MPNAIIDIGIVIIFKKKRPHQEFDYSCDKSAKALLITIVEDRSASAIKIWVNYGDKNCNRANEGGDNHRLGLNGHHQIF